MQYEHARNSVLGWVASDLARDIDDAQFNELVKKITYTVRDLGIVISPEAVAVHAEQLFPELYEEEEMQRHQRVVPPRQAQQSHEDIVAEINRYVTTGHWEKCASEFATPWSQDGKGVGSKTNYVLLATALKELAQQGKKIRVPDICEVVLTLAFQGVLERKPQVQVVAPPPPPPKPTARDLNNKRVKFERKLNDRDTSPIRGAKEDAKPLVDQKPVLTEEQKQEINGKNKADNEIIQTALWRLNTFTGRTHGHTASGRAVLKATFEESMDEGLAAQAVLDAVVAKIEQLTDSGSIR